MSLLGASLEAAGALGAASGFASLEGVDVPPAAEDGVSLGLLDVSLGLLEDEPDAAEVSFDFFEDEAPVEPLTLTGERRPPEPWEAGRKDTVVAYPGEVTRLRMTFETPGQFVWHCHIVEHEDNEMMRPYRIGPVQPGQPSG